MYGIYGYEDEETGCLNGLGFIGYDVQCMSKFFPFYSWTSPIEGTKISSEGYKSLRAEQSDDFDDLSGGLIAITIIVWVLVLGLMLYLVIEMMRDRKKSGAVGHQ